MRSCKGGCRKPHLLKGTQLVVLDDLLQAELQVLEHCTQLVLVCLLELGVLQYVM